MNCSATNFTSHFSVCNTLQTRHETNHLHSIMNHFIRHMQPRCKVRGLDTWICLPCHVPGPRGQRQIPTLWRPMYGTGERKVVASFPKNGVIHHRSYSTSCFKDCTTSLLIMYLGIQTGQKFEIAFCVTHQKIIFIWCVSVFAMCPIIGRSRLSCCTVEQNYH